MPRSGLPRREGRRHGIPPTPDWRAEFEVLDELASEQILGLALWEGLRDVALWARARGDRGGLFHPRRPGFRAYAPDVVASLAPELVHAWAGLETVALAPEDTVRERLADACRQVYAWAEERALMQTAAHFAEAAALVNPDVPALANLAARTCRRAALPGRAGPWYVRGRALAVRAKSFPDRFSATVGYGWLMYSFGRYERARRIINTTVRQAVNRGFKRMAGEAEHALLAICSEEGMLRLGESHARNALSLYPIHHERLPALVHDVGYLFVATGMYSAGLAILTDAVKAFTRPQEAMIVWSTVARAAAGAGEPDVYATARDNVLGLLPRYPEHAPAALRNLAYAAQHAGDWDVAEEAARRAAETAHARRMEAVERTAREVLARVRERAPGAPAVEPPADLHVEGVVRTCRRRIRQWNGPRRGRPPGQTPPA